MSLGHERRLKGLTKRTGATRSDTGRTGRAQAERHSTRNWDRCDKVDCPIAVGGKRRFLADWRRPALGTAGPKPAIQEVALNVSKVASKSSAGAPALGQYPPFRRRSRLRTLGPTAYPAGRFRAGP